MQNPSDLYRLETDVDLNVPGSGVLVVAMGAFIDAGEVQRMLSEHLVETGAPEMVATFDIDQLFDYRARRPVMVFDTNRFAEYKDPSMRLQRLIEKGKASGELVSSLDSKAASIFGGGYVLIARKRRRLSVPRRINPAKVTVPTGGRLSPGTRRSSASQTTRSA